jgi:hypothetical protein
VFVTQELYPYVDTLEREVELIARVCGVLSTTSAENEAAVVTNVAKAMMQDLFRDDAPGGDDATVGHRNSVLVNHFLVCFGLIKVRKPLSLPPPFGIRTWTMGMKIVDFPSPSMFLDNFEPLLSFQLWS